MDSDNEKPSWWSQTKRVLFSPRSFFAHFPEPSDYRSSVIYLAKTALVVSLINSLVLTAIFYVVVDSFASILTAFMMIFGALLTPLIAVAANIQPDKVPGVIESLARNGGLEVRLLSAKIGAFLFVAYFGTVIISTCIQAGVAHGVARLMGSAHSFRATAAAYSFGSAAWMLSVVPVVSVAMPIYCAVLYIFGMQQAHKLSRAKAILAVLVAAAVVPGIAFLMYCGRLN
ncbi:MAG: YIP1 family protein [Candidatus Obscuribacterales bacterium]